ncbi:MAG: phosphotransferase [Spirochaetes bacterium]|nr:phosphotransferase [Spirochaetota bacterium]
MAPFKVPGKILTKESFLRLMPEWSDCRNIIISVLSGGITNKLYRVRSEKGDIAVRIYGYKTGLFINRDNEAEAIAKMAQIGLSPGLVKYIPEKHATIVDFITGGYTLNNNDFLREDFVERIIDPVRKIHKSGEAFTRIFNPLKEIKKMLKILNSTVTLYPEFDTERTIGRLETLFGIISIPESEYTPCHNDLLADNFILNRSGYIQLIDWEYAGMAPEYYDIADMFQEILVPGDVEKLFVKHYCEGLNLNMNLRMVDLFKPFPDIFWFLWSMIQNRISTIDFDFYNYGKAKYKNALRNLKSLNSMYGIKV